MLGSHYFPAARLALIDRNKQAEYRDDPSARAELQGVRINGSSSHAELRLARGLLRA